MEILPLIIQLASGALGGNVAGKIMPKLSLGSVGNSIAGIIGGGIGGQLLNMLGVGASAPGAMDIGSIIASIAGGGLGGGVLMAIVGFIKTMLKKQSA